MPAIHGALLNWPTPSIFSRARVDLSTGSLLNRCLPGGGAMSDESDVEKVLANAERLKYLGRNRAFLTLLFAIWATRKRGGILGLLAKLCILAGGASGCGYLTGFFSYDFSAASRLPRATVCGDNACFPVPRLKRSLGSEVSIAQNAGRERDCRPGHLHPITSELRSRLNEIAGKPDQVVWEIAP